jgi:hypothetical protein
MKKMVINKFGSDAGIFFLANKALNFLVQNISFKEKKS